MEQIVAPFKNDKLCFLTSREACQNFTRASANLGNLKLKSAQKFHVPDLLNNDYVFITKQGLVELEEVIGARHANAFRNKKKASDETIEKWKERKIDPFDKKIIKPIVEAESLEGYDDSKPVDITTAALRKYIADLSKMQQTQQQQ